MAVSSIEINLSALRHNLHEIRSLLPKKVNILAVVKANAYGHGAVPTMEIALQEGFTGACVARVKEGEELRRAGFTCPIYILGLPLLEDMITGIINDLILPVDDSVDLNLLDTIAASEEKTAKVTLAVDTGMNRIGIHPDNVESFLKTLKGYSHLQLVGTFTHMATADCEDKSPAKKQVEEFKKVLQYLPKDENFMVSCANSAGILDMPESWFNMVRPGIIMYGSQPSEDMDHTIDIQPVLSLKSRLSHVQTLYKGEAVGYGGTYVADKDVKIATIPVGYADGYPRSLSNNAYVLLHGKRFPVIGRICMDQFMILCDDSAKPNDEVVLIGKQGNEEITVDELAEWAGTIPHEITCNLKRIPRIFVNR
jgi:alanine racemase